MEPKLKSIMLAKFDEELLPSGRKLLHCVFKEKFGTFRYIWTPPWKGNFGVERLFFKALEVEEWNDYEGVWSKELRQAAAEIPALEEIKLPVKIQLGEIADIAEDEELPRAYRVAIDVLSEEATAYKEVEGVKTFICVDKVKFSWDSLKSFIFKVNKIWSVSTNVEDATECIAWYENGACAQRETVGVRFYVWLEAGLEKNEYLVIAKEIAFNIRSFVRKGLSDYRALKRGFEEL